MTPSELEKLRADSSVTWIEEDRYRLADDPPWMTRRVPQQLRPEPQEKEESAADRERREMYERMANYEGSPEYQAMLERNGGVAPGQKSSPSKSLKFYSGPRGGKYTKGVTKDGRPYRRYF